MNMSPGSTTEDVVDGAQLDTKPTRDIATLATLKGQCAQLANDPGGEHRAAMAFTAGLSIATLLYFIVAVGLVVAKEEMRWVHAPGVVAAVQNEHIIWRRPIFDFPCDPMGISLCAIPSHATVIHQAGAAARVVPAAVDNRGASEKRRGRCSSAHGMSVSQ